ncbi:NlpC/P60 family protein [Sphaerisporangium sp. NPDC005289]|uniref:C40 family peptidase n=1 Tax=Sphaerisporangium sp. NPDC005289 TaxID=3155247 RepID=UPI0033ACC0FE
MRDLLPGEIDTSTPGEGHLARQQVGARTDGGLLLRIHQPALVDRRGPHAGSPEAAESGQPPGADRPARSLPVYRRPPRVPDRDRSRSAPDGGGRRHREAPDPAFPRSTPDDAAGAARSQRRGGAAPTAARAVPTSRRPAGDRSASRSRQVTAGAIAARAAVKKIGTPYVWGGGSRNGATKGGFDCSGLALYAWSRAGVSLPHYTGSQFTRGSKIPFSRLKEGDLVFFGGGAGDPTHVGIYLKKGMMVHAPKSGDVVRTVDFAHSAYYRARYRGAIRPGK